MKQAVQVKICGLTRQQDAAAAAAAGATFGGVILAAGSPRTVSPERVDEIFGSAVLVRCGVFVDETVARIVELVERLDLGVVQLHGDETPELARSVRSSVDAAVWKAVRPRTRGEFVAAVDAFDGVVDALLLDGWSATARGGTGTPFPWREVAGPRAELGYMPNLVAAGGLNAENVAEVIALLRPEVVDVSSGVERSPGLKDAEKIRRFAAAAGASLAEKGVA